MDQERPYILDLTSQELAVLMRSWDEPSYRAHQLYRQLYKQFILDPHQMTDLPLDLRRRLRGALRWEGNHLGQVIKGDQGLTHKALFTLSDGSPIETVLMRYPDRTTLCVSSQSGCPMACSFCATGQLRFLHDLTAGSIMDQVLWGEKVLQKQNDISGLRSSRGDLKKRELQRRITHIVFMGMGEPFNNYDQWWAAVERLHDPEGYHLGARHITVSTVGLVPGIRRLAQEKLPINLAISLHAPNDTLRSQLMPVNRKYPLAELLEATRGYLKQTHRRVSFEYVLLQDKNDSPTQALELAELLRNGSLVGYEQLCHVNLIPWNPIPGTNLSRSHRKRVGAFQSVLRKHHIPCTVRIERGVDMAAACGQLAGELSAV